MNSWRQANNKFIKCLPAQQDGCHGDPDNSPAARHEPPGRPFYRG
jgi:hypothetical protein